MYTLSRVILGVGFRNPEISRNRRKHERRVSRGIEDVKRDFSNATLTPLALGWYLEDFSIFDLANQDFQRRECKPDQSFFETTATYMKMCCFSNEQPCLSAWMSGDNRGMGKSRYSVVNFRVSSSIVESFRLVLDRVYF